MNLFEVTNYYLSEFMDLRVPEYKVLEKDDEQITIGFRLDSGDYRIFIHPYVNFEDEYDDNGTWDLSFDKVGNMFSTTNLKDFSVIPSVFGIMKDFIDGLPVLEKPSQIFYTAAKDTSEKTSDSARGRIYQNMIKRYFPLANITRESVPGSEDDYTIDLRPYLNRN